MTKLTAIIDRIFDQHFIYKKSIIRRKRGNQEEKYREKKSLNYISDGKMNKVSLVYTFFIFDYYWLIADIESYDLLTNAMQKKIYPNFNIYTVSLY